MGIMKKTICKIIAFVVLFAVILTGMTKVFTAKFHRQEPPVLTRRRSCMNSRTTASRLCSTEAAKMVSGISSMKLYEDYGISAYGTGSPNQGILCSLGLAA